MMADLCSAIIRTLGLSNVGLLHSWTSTPRWRIGSNVAMAVFAAAARD